MEKSNVTMDTIQLSETHWNEKKDTKTKKVCLFLSFSYEMNAIFMRKKQKRINASA